MHFAPIGGGRSGCELNDISSWRCCEVNPPAAEGSYQGLRLNTVTVQEDATPGRYGESIRVGGRPNPQGILKDLLEPPFRDEVRHGRDIR
jgi:hypothetical protein